MTALRLQDFSGLAPRRSSRLLPETMATIANNTNLLSGELRGFTDTKLLADFSSSAYNVFRAFRVPGTPSDTWLKFDHRDVDVVRSPVINDSYNRYYWAGDGQPLYNTEARIFSNSVPLYLGVPTPVAAPTVTPPAGTDYTRSYVYTFVSAYGEEGPPSPPTLATGNAGTWALSAMDTAVPNSANRNITTVKIYRTVPGTSQTLFYYVGEVALGASTFNDTATDAEAALNPTLESTSWLEPPSDLEGFVAMPGGYLVGWVGRRLVFSEPYHPHAWPAEYELATEFDIVGLAVWGTTLVIGTQSQPYVGQGQDPASFTMQKLGTVEPCLSRRGMVSTVAGVYYPSINGLTMVNANGANNVTQDLLTKKEWANYNPSDIYAAQLGLQYLGFYDSSHGFIFNPTEQQARLVNLTSFVDVDGIETDPYTGDVFLLQNNRAMSWDQIGQYPVDWQWRSKDFLVPKPVNFGAYRIDFDTSTIDVGDAAAAIYVPYNTSRFAVGPLSTLNGHALCSGGQNPGHVSGWVIPEWRMPLGGSPLYPITTISSLQPYVRLRVYADGVLKYDYSIIDNDIHRLPAGFKSARWQLDMISNSTVYSVQVAETPKELSTV